MTMRSNLHPYDAALPEFFLAGPYAKPSRRKKRQMLRKEVE
jgi:hypothetical protein